MVSERNLHSPPPCEECKKSINRGKQVKKRRKKITTDHHQMSTARGCTPFFSRSLSRPVTCSESFILQSDCKEIYLYNFLSFLSFSCSRVQGALSLSLPLSFSCSPSARRWRAWRSRARGTRLPPGARTPRSAGSATITTGDW